MIVWRILAELADLQNIRILQVPVLPKYDEFKFDVDLTGVIGVNIATNENITFHIDNDNLILQCGQNVKIFPLESKITASAVFQNPRIITEAHIKKLLGITELKRISKSKLPEPKLLGKHCVIDLCSIRPSLVIDDGKEIDLPFRLLTQHYTKDKGEQLLDCKDSEAIMLRADNTTIAMSELFLNKTDVPIAKKSSAAKFFCEMLKEKIDTEKLTYLLPDCIDDFEIDILRRSLNFYFPNAEPLPRSIAAVLVWQASESFHTYNIQAGNRIIVIENIGQYVIITQIECKFSEELKKDIPQTLGFYWERYPVVEF
jgi:hypothetical protein